MQTAQQLMSTATSAMWASTHQYCIERINGSFLKNWEFSNLPSRAALAAEMGMAEILKHRMEELLQPYKLKGPPTEGTPVYNKLGLFVGFLRGPVTISWSAN